MLESDWLMKCKNIVIMTLQAAKMIFYTGNEKYVLVLVQCHDGMITNSTNLYLRLTLVFGMCKTKQIYLIRDHRIMTLDSNQSLHVILQTLRGGSQIGHYPAILNVITSTFQQYWCGCAWCSNHSSLPISTTLLHILISEINK